MKKKWRRNKLSEYGHRALFFILFSTTFPHTGRYFASLVIQWFGDFYSSKSVNPYSFS